MLKTALTILVVAILTGCGQDHGNQTEHQTSLPVETVYDEPLNPETESEDKEDPTTDPKDLIDLELKPNEAGRIMILMYHNIGDVEAEWVRTPENFRKDLGVLYDRGYRPIRLEDYLTGNITTPMGYTPVVLTFDDGNRNNFEIMEDGSINPDSAVGILMEFSRENPDFRSHATFFLTGDVPFGQRGMEREKLEFLIENGMDIGNHSKTHPNFSNANGEMLQAEIGGQAQYLEELIDYKDYNVNTLALPFGSRPKDKDLMNYLVEGIYDKVKYSNIGILNVGWNPAYSPYDNRFDFGSIPRIRASEMKVDNVGMYNYIEYFDNNPGERFISDGFPDLITVPDDKAGHINSEGGIEVYIYNNGKDQNEVDN